MKTLLIAGLLIITTAVAQTLHSQTANDVVNKYIAAMGGKEKLATLKTVRMEGSLTVQGTDMAVVITKKHLTGMRIDMSAMGTENYQIITPTKGTVFMPMQGMPIPLGMPDDLFKSYQPELALEGPFVNYMNKGTAVELMGNDTVNGENCYNLKVTYNYGITINYFISTNTSYLVKTRGKVIISGEERETTNTYSNYKQNADGFWFPYRTSNIDITLIDITTDYTKIDTNIPVDDSIFNQ